MQVGTMYSAGGRSVGEEGMDGCLSVGVCLSHTWSGWGVGVVLGWGGGRCLAPISGDSGRAGYESHARASPSSPGPPSPYTPVPPHFLPAWTSVMSPIPMWSPPPAPWLSPVSMSACYSRAAMSGPRPGAGPPPLCLQSQPRRLLSTAPPHIRL